MFPIAPWFYPILFAQSSTPMYINWKGGLWGNTFVSILQLGSKEVFPSKGIMPECSKKIDDGPMNKGLQKKKKNYESTHELLNMNHNRYEVPKPSFNFVILVWIEAYGP